MFDTRSKRGSDVLIFTIHSTFSIEFSSIRKKEIVYSTRTLERTVSIKKDSFSRNKRREK